MRLEEAYERTPLAAVLDLQRFRHHCPGAHLQRRSAGQPVFDDGDQGGAFFFVIEGRVKLVKRVAGPRDTILDLVTPGGSVCQSIPLVGAEHCCTAVADAPVTRLLAVPRSEVLALMAREPAVSEVFVGMLVSRVRAMCGRVVELGQGNSLQRIARELLRLADRIGEAGGAVTHVPLPLSRRDLAELTGMAVETAIRSVRRLERAGYVRTRSEGFDLLDVEALRRIARGAPADGEPAT